MIEVAGLAARAGRGGGAFALRDVTFTVPAGGWGMVIGPAGAGKTTLLETIAGVVRADAGIVRLGGRTVTHLPPEQRGLGLVYQHAYLFPHLTVAENIGYGAGGARSADARAMLERFGLAAAADRAVTRLSGGERQLVALARALARRPPVLLLDEPFAALDPRTRAAVRRELRALYYERGFTALHVTHDFAEAGLLGEVAVLMDGGRVLQAAPPEQLFHRPATPYAASFLGAENVLAGDARPIRAAAPDWAETPDDEWAEHPVAFTTGALTIYALGDAAPGPAHAVIRAEEIALSREAAASSMRNQFRGRVTELLPAGALTKVTVDVTGVPLVAAVTTRSVRELGLGVGAEVFVAFKATAVHLC